MINLAEDSDSDDKRPQITLYVLYFCGTTTRFYRIKQFNMELNLFE